MDPQPPQLSLSNFVGENAECRALDMSVVSYEDHIDLAIVEGSIMPTPQGGIPVPARIRRYPLKRASALELVKSLRDAAEELPEETPEPQSDIVVAKDLSGIDNVAKQQEAFKKGRRPRR